MANEKRLIDPDAKFIEKHFTKRLIDAEAIARKLKIQHCAECNVVRQVQCSACWVNDVLDLLDGDSVDAVEVVHGRWIKQTSYPMKYVCSECGHQKDYRRPYCEICGTKMDGDGNG